jgi:hypothetical protein
VHSALKMMTMCSLLMIAQSAAVLADKPKDVRPWSECRFVSGRAIVTFSTAVDVRDEADAQDNFTDDATLNVLFKELRVTNVIKLVPDACLSRLKAPPDFFHTFVILFDVAYDVPAAVASLEVLPAVQHVEPDLLRKASLVPNDPLWSNQWDKRIMGAPAVWNVSAGSRNIICAGIDVGVDWNHPDLTPALWVNPGEDINHNGVAWTNPSYPGDPDDLDGIDNDNNGFIDDFLGWDFIRNISNCGAGEDCDGHTDNNPLGTNDHGTHVAGIMCATGNNGVGVAGMSWVGTIMALRAGFNANDGNGYLPESATLPAILYAVANGAKIINMSYGGGGYASNEQEAMTSAWTQGAMLFAASGNDGVSTTQYPAAYEDVIAVNATNSQDRLASWSNRGTWTDLCAPGANPGIMSTVINGYGEMEGTSMASPNCGGAAALVWSVFPNMTNAQVRDLLFNSAADITAQNPSVTPSFLGHGRVDVQRALASFYPQIRVTNFVVNDVTGGDGDGRLERGESAQFAVTCTNQPGWANGTGISMVIRSPDPRVTVQNDSIFLGDIAVGQSASNTNSPATLTAVANLDAAFWLDLYITFSSASGYSETQPARIRVGRGSVLIVDDDGGADYEQYYVSAVANVGTSQDLWTIAIDGALAQSEIAQYQAIIWSCGDQSTATLTADDQTHVTSYLNSGGKLMLVGQNIDEDLRGTSFYSDVLHAQSASGGTNRELDGIAGNPISNGMTLVLGAGGCAGNGMLSPSCIVPVGGAEEVFGYSTGGTAAVMYSGAYKLAYFAFALEAACGQGSYAGCSQVVVSVLRWMNVLDAAPRETIPLPRRVLLHEAYPNPFNPRTTIAFDLPTTARVQLRVFDVLGREVASLVDGKLEVGSHQVVFDGSRLASGTYMIWLQAGDVIQSSKIILAK